jgi:hypothetical protein
MSTPSREWVFADVWVLASIGHSHRCSLADLLGAGDMINHAILLSDELDSALGKLTGAGLVRVYDDWTFELTDDGLTLWADGSRDLRAHLKSVQEQLVDFEPGAGVVKVPRAIFRAAVEEYQSR